ncbi:ChbG/HpnK family deacetylase [Chitinophagaceae bacterium MMS25-I14]
MAYLTINADDFGLTEGVTRGIHTAIAAGVVTSTSAMACAPDGAKHLHAFAGITPGTIGAHLQLTQGKPVLPAAQIPSLVNEQGVFYASSKTLPWHLDPGELYEEWKAQVARLQDWGIRPAYLDTHHNVHLMAHILPVIARLATELNVPVRAGSPITAKALRKLGAATPDVTILDFFDDNLDADRLIRSLEKELEIHGEHAIIEVCCHPGISCTELAQMSKYTTQRETELAIFTAPGTRSRIENLGLHLAGMAQACTLKPALT